MRLHGPSGEGSWYGFVFTQTTAQDAWEAFGITGHFPVLSIVIFLSLQKFKKKFFLPLVSIAYNVEVCKSQCLSLQFSPYMFRTHWV